jgi:hypothetical protein
MADLIKSVVLAADKLKQTQQIYHDAAITLQHTIAAEQEQASRFELELEGIKQILREGFRLPAERREDDL